MPFKCKFQLNNGAIDNNDIIIFSKFINDSFYSFNNSPVNIAEVFVNGKRAYIISTCPCVPSHKCNLIEGQSIDCNTIIGYFDADGDDIPYNKPYAQITFET